jgi:hypothetical protein
MGRLRSLTTHDRGQHIDGAGVCSGQLGGGLQLTTDDHSVDWIQRVPARSVCVAHLRILAAKLAAEGR